jgi:hypothetical protein
MSKIFILPLFLISLFTGLYGQTANDMYDSAVVKMKKGDINGAIVLYTKVVNQSPYYYDAWLDSLAHSEMTGGAASMSDEIDAELSAWDGYITGRNLELIPGERIVQSWRTTRFAEADPDSRIEVMLEPVPGGTRVTVAHSCVPDGHTGYQDGGCQHGGASTFGRPPEPTRPLLRKQLHRPLRPGCRGCPQ